ncbi:MAG: SURF1 family protein [Pararhizobium sp.]
MHEESLDRPRGRAARIVTPILILLAFCLLVGLGTWQVRRLHWKEGLLAEIAERMHAAPGPLAEIEAMQAAGKDIEYYRVRVSGTFDNTKERHFFATFKGQSGFFVYTPLETDSGQVVFVNRGFVPYDRKDPATRPGSQPAGHVTLTGLARSAPSSKPSFIVPDNDVAKDVFYWKDLKTMAASVGLGQAQLVPFFIDADRDPNSKALPIGGVTVVDLPNDHLQYALTWYGLALVLAAVTIGSYYRRRRSG